VRLSLVRPLFLGLLVLAVLNAVVYAAFTRPAAVRQRAVASRVEALRSELAREEAAVAGLRRRAFALETNARDARRFYRVAVEGKKASLVPILRHVEAFAKEQGLSVGKQTFTTTPLRDTGLERFSVSMPVSGSYRQFVALLGRLEQSSYFLTLDDVRLGGGDMGGGRIRLDLTLSCYFRESAPPGGAG
jgi:hypothetical protein